MQEYPAKTKILIDRYNNYWNMVLMRIAYLLISVVVKILNVLNTKLY